LLRCFSLRLETFKHDNIEEAEEHPPCAVCDRKIAAPLVVRNGYQVVRCTTCGLVYISPRPKRQEAIEALYTDRRYSARQVSHALDASRMHEAQWRLNQVERHAPRRGRLLDVGCSAGSFLLAARERGWDARGIDVSPDAVQHASGVHGLDVRVATIEEAAFPSQTFDVITLFECIEHMLHPDRALRAAARLLRDDGILVITTPNVDGFVPRSTYQLLARTIGAWEHPTPPHHLYQFSRRTLGAILRKSGFQPVACNTRPMGFRYTVKQLEGAVIEAIKRHASGLGASGLGARPSDRPSHIPSRGGIEREGPAWLARIGDTIMAGVTRVSRAGIAGLCWLLSAALYAIPIHHVGGGDSMIAIARK